jgi:hypothetical protein
MAPSSVSIGTENRIQENQTKMQNRNKMKFNFDDHIPTLCFAAAALLILGSCAFSVGQVMVTQQALNRACKTDYNFIQVALAGNNLSRICRMENQSITIK